MLTSSVKQQLDEQGCLVSPEFLSASEVAQFVQLPEGLYALEGDLAGSEFKQELNTRHLANCTQKREMFEKVIETSAVLEGMKAVLGPGFKLSSLNLRSANPNSRSGRPLHADSAAVAEVPGAVSKKKCR